MAGQSERGVRAGARVQRPLRGHVVLLHDAVLPSGARYARCGGRNHVAFRYVWGSQAEVILLIL